MVEDHCVLMETSAPLASLRLLWHWAQLPEPAKWLVAKVTRGAPGSKGVVEETGGLPEHAADMVIIAVAPRYPKAFMDLGIYIGLTPFLRLPGNKQSVFYYLGRERQCQDYYRRLQDYKNCFSPLLFREKAVDMIIKICLTILNWQSILALS